MDCDELLGDFDVWNRSETLAQLRLMPWSFSRCLVIIRNSRMDCDKSAGEFDVDQIRNINSAELNAMVFQQMSHRHQQQPHGL